jgi:hypothetical protein
LVLDEAEPDWRFQHLGDNCEGATFGLKSQTEVVLSLQGNAYRKSNIFLQLVIGAEDNSVSWISLVKKGKKTKINPKI